MKSVKKTNVPLVPIFAGAILLLGLWGAPARAGEPAPAKALRAKVTQDVIKKWSPEFQFHRLERFLPSSIEALLKGAERYREGDPKEKWIAINSPNELAGLGGEWRIAFDPANPKFRSGDLTPDRKTVTAPIYVSVRIPGDASYVELDYRALFGFNGPQSVRCHDGTSNFNYALPAFAEHEGDWEGVNLTLTPDLASVVMVTTEAHGDSKDWLPEDLDWTDKTHARISSAVNSHGMYNAKRFHTDKDDWVELEDLNILSLVDVVSPQGPNWKPWTLAGNEFRLMGRDPSGQPAKETWATFSGRMGTYKRNEVESPCDFNGGSLSTMNKITATAQTLLIKGVKSINMLDEGLFNGAPCGGPGSRSCLRVEIPAPPSMKDQKHYVIQSRVPGNMVLSINGTNPNDGVVLAPFQQGDPTQRWYLLTRDGRAVQEANLTKEPLLIVNVSTGMSLRSQGGQGKPVTLVSPLAKTAWNTWTIGGSRGNCAIRPVVTDSQNLNVFGNGPYRAGSAVGTWEWGRGAGNETWTLTEAK